MTKPLMSAYIDGIKEARDYFNTFPCQNVPEFRVHKSNAGLLMRDASPIMRDFYKGQRDFWANQIKLRKESKK